MDETLKYYGWWDSYESMKDSFFPNGRDVPEDFPTPEQILFASYDDDGGGYGGDAVVVFERDGQLYEVHGGHCSCYGLEDQWNEEETNEGALRIRRTRDEGASFLDYHQSEAKARYRELWPYTDLDALRGQKKAA